MKLASTAPLLRSDAHRCPSELRPGADAEPAIPEAGSQKVPLHSLPLTRTGDRGQCRPRPSPRRESKGDSGADRGGTKVISNQCVRNQFRGPQDKAGNIITDHCLTDHWLTDYFWICWSPTAPSLPATHVLRPPGFWPLAPSFVHLLRAVTKISVPSTDLRINAPSLHFFFVQTPPPRPHPKSQHSI